MRWRFAGFELELAARELRKDGELVPLQPQVLALLIYLVEQRARAIPKRELLEQLWPDAVVTEASLQRAMSLLRTALGDAGKDAIRTVAKHGYRFVAPVEQDEGAIAMPGPPSYVRIDDVHVAWTTVGSGAIDVVFVLPWAFPMRALFELAQARELIAQAATLGRVVLFDKRGTGQSDRVKAIQDLETRVGDLHAVLRAAQSRRAIVVGWSEGAPLAIELCARHPERVAGLVLVGGFPVMDARADFPCGWSPARIAELRGYVASAWGRGATMIACVPEHARSPAVVAWAAHAEQAGASPGAALELLEMNLRVDVRARLPALAMPVTILHAKHDRVIDPGCARVLAAAIRGAELALAPGDDHLFLFDHRAQLLAALRGIVARA
ncbi:MAG TPA: alpha/beta fold hydrolase [Nannocystaceae bacterium]|nr:alpha/beta fold hydrolase [Nannocystaceae bacterium]